MFKVLVSAGLVKEGGKCLKAKPKMLKFSNVLQF